MESIEPPSLVSEKSVLMAFDFQSAVDKCLLVLEDLKGELLEDAIDSFLLKFAIKDEDDLVTVTSRYQKKKS